MAKKELIISKIIGILGISLILSILIMLILKTITQPISAKNILNRITTWTTPIFWTGYIFLMDSLIFHIKKESLIIKELNEFFGICLLSIVFWLIFEIYNFFIKNWYYINWPESIIARYIGVLWSFATIMPGIFLTSLFVSSVLFKRFNITKRRKRNIKPALIKVFIFIGSVFLVVPFILPERLANYTACLVWTGFFFLFDAINYHLNIESILGDLKQGNYNRLLSLVVAGFICGILWESTNYSAFTKWKYNVPILPEIKIFEMPILGYLGFPAFALELFSMYYFTKYLLNSLVKRL
jgi:hypothetical protein